MHHTFALRVYHSTPRGRCQEKIGTTKCKKFNMPCIFAYSPRKMTFLILHLADLRYLHPHPLDSGRGRCYNSPIISHAKRCGRGVGRKRCIPESGRWWKSRMGPRLKNTSKPKPNAARPPVGAAWRRHVTSVGACWGPQRSKSGGTTESGLRPEILG